MEDLNRLLIQLRVPTYQISQEGIQEVLLTTKKCGKSYKENKELWKAITQVLWEHLESGLNIIDDQLLCATCFYAVLTLVEEEIYLKKILTLIEEELHLRKEHSKKNRSCHAVSLIYGIFQSSYLLRANKSENVAAILQASFKLLCSMAYEYSKFTFIAFKCISLFRKVSKTLYVECLFTKENEITLLNVINHNWENPLTGVRDLNKKILQTLISIIDIVQYRTILNEINSFYWNKAKYLMLAEIVSHPNYIDISFTMMNSDWLDGLLDSLYKPGLVSAGADMYYSILKRIKSQDVWCEIFIKPIINLLNGSSKKAIENFSNYWCVTTLKTFSGLSMVLLDHLKDIEDLEQKLYSSLNVMKQANKLGLLSKNWHSADYNYVEKIVLAGVVHRNNQIRMMAFEIICLSQNKVIPTSVEYEIILNFLHDNINSDCTVLRISMLNSYSCFLSQLHISFINYAENCHDTKALKCFCYNFQEFIIKSLQTEGNYQRKITCIKLTHTFLNNLSEVPRKKEKQTKLCNETIIQMLKDERVHWLMDQENVLMSFVRLLKDPADDIRENIGKLLYEHYLSQLRQTNMLNLLIKDALESMSSKFFYDISCGESMFKLIINILIQGDQPQALFKNLDDVFNFAYTELISEYKLNRGIVESINLGKQLHSYMSILHGVLEICLQKQHPINILNESVMELLDALQGTSNQFAWEQDTSKNSDFSKMSDMVQDIILKSGRFPSSDESDIAKISGLEKIVLMCLWLNVKASCDLSSIIIRHTKDDTQVEICREALNIISHVLETCRHKGAIEAAGTALGKSIIHLTSLNERLETSKLPSLFLESKLKELISEANKMASVTRRGAGLSIMVHRIVSSDTKRHKPLFHYFMKTILETCNNAEDIPNLTDKGEDIDREKDLPKAIFIHFLTRIVTDSSLATHVMFYSAELAELAFNNLTNPQWQIRNAALQLYGALIQKLIGQKKASGENEATIVTVACDELRTHSPKLWSYLISKLQNVKCQDEIQDHNNLIPILNMLASLAPRYNFSYDTASQIQTDEDLLIKLMLLLGSPIYIVRRLTAQSVYNIYPLESVIGFLKQHKCDTENYLHGMLLLVAKYSKYRFTTNYYKTIFEDLGKEFNYILTKKHSYLCKEIYEEIFDDGKTNVDNLNKTLRELNENTHAPGIYVWANKRFQKLIRKATWDEIPQVLKTVLNCNEFEIYCGFIVDKIELSNSIPETTISGMVDEILQFKNKFNSGVIWKMLYQILTKTTQEWLRSQYFDIADVYKFLEDKQVSYKLRYIIPFVTKIIALKADETHLLDIARIIESLNDPDTTNVEMRYIAAIANNEITINFKNLSDNVKTISIKSAVILLQDEDEDVRMLSTNFYPMIMNLKESFQPNVCLFKILNLTFLNTVLTKTGINILTEELTHYLLRISTPTIIDEYNPFANDSNNIYLEVNVLKELIEKLKSN